MGSNAEDATSETLRRLWARVLTGEARQPKSYSFLTLEFLRNVSVDDAHLIEKLAPFVIDGRIARSVDSFLDEVGLTFEVLLGLQELGIIAGVEALGLSVTVVN